MPLYAYRCTRCGHNFERIQSFNSEPVTECPQCHGVVERQLTAPALQFKGAGWYVTDYASKGGPASSDSASSEAKAAPDAKASPPAAGSSSSPAAESSKAAADTSSASPKPPASAA